MLRRLRGQMLVALGLPACWTAPGSGTTVDPRANPTPPPAAVAVRHVPGEFDAHRCVRDAIPETVCGLVGSERACGGTAERLVDVERTSQLFVTDPGDVTKFKWDERATETYAGERAAGGDDDRVGQGGGGGGLSGGDDAAEDNPCCFSQCTALVVGEAAAVQPPAPRDYHYQARCIPAPPGGTSHPATADRRCPAAIEYRGVMSGYTETRADMCCYDLLTKDPVRVHVIRGRAAHFADTAARVTPPRVREPAVRESVVRESAVRDPVVCEPDARDEAAAAWLAAARTEHESVAVFEALAEDLGRLGAPAALVDGARAAARDEHAHARASLAIARRYGARFDGWPAHREIRRCATIEALAEVSFVDGCIGETIAAAEAARAAELAVDAAVAAALAAIAEDEARHAALAWSIVAWCVERRPSIAATMLQVGERAWEPRDPSIAAHGFPALAPIAEAAIAEVVAPCVEALRSGAIGAAPCVEARQSKA